jgi:hypothetical protein
MLLHVDADPEREQFYAAESGSSAELAQWPACKVENHCEIANYISSVSILDIVAGVGKVINLSKRNSVVIITTIKVYFTRHTIRKNITISKNRNSVSMFSVVRPFTFVSKTVCPLRNTITRPPVTLPFAKVAFNELLTKTQ